MSKKQREVLLAARRLGTRYGAIQALHDVDLVVHPGQIVALVGANGAGKSTLLRTLSGVQPASAGAVEFQGQDITAWTPERRVKAGISQVPEGRQVFGPMTVADNLRLGGFTVGKDALDEGLTRAYSLFPVLYEKRHLMAGALSGGQQQMLAMGRALMAKPRLLLLDEPSMGLAPLIVAEVFRLLQRLRGEGLTLLVVEQNARAALSISDFGYVLELGRVVATGAGQKLLENEDIRRAYLGM